MLTHRWLRFGHWHPAYTVCLFSHSNFASLLGTDEAEMKPLAAWKSICLFLLPPQTVSLSAPSITKHQCPARRLIVTFAESVVARLRCSVRQTNGFMGELNVKWHPHSRVYVCHSSTGTNGIIRTTISGTTVKPDHQIQRRIVFRRRRRRRPRRGSSSGDTCVWALLAVNRQSFGLPETKDVGIGERGKVLLIWF